MPDSPSTQNYALGRGVLSIGEWVGDTPPGDMDFHDVGNCTDFKLKVTEEKLEHFSSRSGLKKKDKVVTLQIGYEGSFVLDEVSVRNLAMFLRGTQNLNVVNAATKLSQEFAVKFVSANPVGPDYTWELWKLNLTPNGEFSLISDDWAAMEFSIEGLADESIHPSSPYLDVTFATTTTTTTTTV